MAKIEASQIEKVGRHTREAFEKILSGLGEKDSFEGKNTFVQLMRRPGRSVMMSSQSTTNVRDVLKRTVAFQDVAGRTVEEVAGILPVDECFLKHQVFHHLHVKLSEKRFLYNLERLPTREDESISSRRCPFSRTTKERNATVDSFDTDEMWQMHTVCQTQKLLK